MDQLNIFGEWVNIETNIKRPVLSLKDKFRMKNGYVGTERCKSCSFIRKYEYKTRIDFKCIALGIDYGPETTISEDDYACIKYK